MHRLWADVFQIPPQTPMRNRCMQFMRRFIFKLLIVLLPFLFGQNIFGQSSSPSITSNDYYNFFNSLINPDSVKTFNLESRPDFSYILNDTTSIFGDTSLFSSADIQFIKQQIMVGQNFHWKSNKILGAIVINSKKIKKLFKSSVDGGWTEFNKRYKNGFATFSVPLFTVDKNTCIVYRAGHCGGLCGRGGTSVYKKINGKWTFVRGIGMVWVS
jgi:hypothetical protein